MKKRVQFLLAAVLMISVTFIGCKKSDSSSTTNDDAALTAHSEDQNGFSQATDEIANDGNNAISGYAAFQGRPGDANGTNGVAVLPCNATAVLDSAGGVRRLTITYNGLNCAGTRTRTGVVVYSIPLAQRWRDTGAVITMSVQNLVITRVSDGKSITVAGTATVTNVSGGRVFDLGQPGGPTSITHAIASTGMTITFDNGSARSWQIAKQRVFTYANGSIVITTTGTYNDGTYSNISEWGTNRFGNAFVTTISQPMVIRESCQWRLTSGQITHYKLAATIVATFGLDSAGNPTTCPGPGVPYYFKIVWTGANGVVRTFILPY